MSKAKITESIDISAGADPGFHPSGDIQLLASKYILTEFLQYFLKTQALKT